MFYAELTKISLIIIKYCLLSTALISRTSFYIPDREDLSQSDRVFLFHIETICCDPSFESSRRDGLDEGSQHMFLCSLQELFLFIIKYLLLSRALVHVSRTSFSIPDC